MILSLKSLFWEYLWERCIKIYCYVLELSPRQAKSRQMQARIGTAYEFQAKAFSSNCMPNPRKIGITQNCHIHHSTWFPSDSTNSMFKECRPSNLIAGIL